MRIAINIVLAVATVFFLCHIDAIPIDRSHGKEIKGKLVPRQLEEELVQFAEERGELLAHESAEQLHEGASKHNITTHSILDAFRNRRTRVQQRLRVLGLSQPRYSDDPLPPRYIAYGPQSWVGAYDRPTEGFGGYDRRLGGFGGYHRQLEGNGRYNRQAQGFGGYPQEGYVP